MVVGFACAGTENTWCARRTLPHAQFFLLIFQALSSAPRLGEQALAEPPPYTLCGCEIRAQKGCTPSNTAPPAVGCAVRTKEKISTAALSPMSPGNKAVQPCLARQTDTRRAISFDSPAAPAKFAKPKSRPDKWAAQWLQRAVARGR